MDYVYIYICVCIFVYIRICIPAFNFFLLSFFYFVLIYAYKEWIKTKIDIHFIKYYIYIGDTHGLYKKSIVF